MPVQIPQVLSPDEVAQLRAAIDAAHWIGGELPEDSGPARTAGACIAAALATNSMFEAAALPARIYPPLFNRYAEGMGSAAHIDDAVRQQKGSDVRIRTDLSAALFLTDPATYGGGELVIEDSFGVHEIKLNAGDLILYPASSLHRVALVTSGERVSASFWVQSLVRDGAQRTLLFDMDLSIRSLSQQLGREAREVVSLTGAYHNLLRMWAEL